MTGCDQTGLRSVWEVRRKIRLSADLTNPADAANVEQTLRDIGGVAQVSLDRAKHTILVRYLVTETDYQALERSLQAAGFPPADGRWARFRSGWYQSLDLTCRGNACARPRTCCNRPPRG